MLFDVYDAESPELNDAHHLDAMTALLGPPPPEFLERSEETRKYWSEDGEINTTSNENKLTRVVFRHMEGPGASAH